MSKILRAALALGLIGLALVGCGREARHEVLTFFFTGVPPLEDEQEPSKAEAEAKPKLSRAELARTEVARRQRQTLIRQIGRLGWSHGPYGAQQCNRCHALQGSLSFRSGPTRGVSERPAVAAGAGRLQEPITELCLGCHTGQGQEEAEKRNLRLHGPVAAGLCVACHSPHQSRRQFMLLRADNVALCTQCHDKAELGQRTPIHVREPKTDCVECHNPHMGKSAMNLKKDYDEWDAY